MQFGKDKHLLSFVRKWLQFEGRQNLFKFWLCHSTAVWLWENYQVSLSLIPLFVKTGIEDLRHRCALSVTYFLASHSSSPFFSEKI